MGFEFITVVPLLPSRCGFFIFGYRVSCFGRFQHFIVNGCSAVSCAFGVFIRRGQARVLLFSHLEIISHSHLTETQRHTEEWDSFTGGKKGEASGMP